MTNQGYWINLSANKNEYVFTRFISMCVQYHAKRSEQKGPEEAKRSHLSPDFTLAKGYKGNLGVTAIQGFSDHGVTFMRTWIFRGYNL
ncbi:hypothetical protein C161_02180 [Paenibacillus sp. FSL R5-192]|nr:hypothetical protein C161_02180 [Paenibacillus sp. FSL R5-192]